MLAGGACSSTTYTEEQSRAIAEEFAKVEATYIFDGTPWSFKLTDTTEAEGGWQFTYEYVSSHAGYGDRDGQMLAQVETNHTAVITVVKGKVTTAVMDKAWDMVKQQMVYDMVIDLMPIEEVTADLLLSNPPQIGVYIKGGLRDGCTIFHDLKITRDGDVINIEVTTQHPKDAVCPAVYTYFETNISLGTDFTYGTTYTINVNDYTTTIDY
jgi:hypothetical protein